jgi:hypothetical protein
MLMRDDPLASHRGPARIRRRVPYTGISYIRFTNLFTEVLWEVRLFCSR